MYEYIPCLCGVCALYDLSALWIYDLALKAIPAPSVSPSSRYGLWRWTRWGALKHEMRDWVSGDDGVDGSMPCHPSTIIYSVWQLCRIWRPHTNACMWWCNRLECADAVWSPSTVQTFILLGQNLNHVLWMCVCVENVWWAETGWINSIKGRTRQGKGAATSMWLSAADGTQCIRERHKFCET